MNDDNFIEEFAALLEVPVEHISDSFNMAVEAHWDSLALLSTMALIDTHYHRIVDPMMIQAAATFRQLKQLIGLAEV